MGPSLTSQLRPQLVSASLAARGFKGLAGRPGGFYGPSKFGSLFPVSSNKSVTQSISDTDYWEVPGSFAELVDYCKSSDGNTIMDSSAAMIETDCKACKACDSSARECGHSLEKERNVGGCAATRQTHACICLVEPHSEAQSIGAGAVTVHVANSLVPESYPKT